MPRLRARSDPCLSSPLDVPQVIADCLRPKHFFEASTIRLEWEHVERENAPWEIFQGRLLDSAHTRSVQSFEAWHIYRVGLEGRSGEPLLSVRWDADRGLVHVTRAIYCHVQEGYHAGDNVYLSRETEKWVRELVGTIRLADVADREELRDELAGTLFRAVVGTSRLPLTSVEAPLPDFTLGNLGYFFRSPRSEAPPRHAPMRSFHDLLEGAWQAELSRLEHIKLLELIVRATPAEHLAAAAAHWVDRFQCVQMGETITSLLRGLFEEVSLSPYTDFVSKTIAFLGILERQKAWSVEDHVDFLSYILRHVCRHLTAYDLVTFHHCGANYPDILLLDAVLKEYLEVLERRPELFKAASDTTGAEEKRRRALRQAWLLRRHYEDHLVPDAPTSLGENARILPPPYARVPDEQITDPSKRTRRLFVDDRIAARLSPTALEVLRKSIEDLSHPREIQELGMATFLDRPLGVFKGPSEPDQTLLLSYKAFSMSIAEKRLSELTKQHDLIGPAYGMALEQRLRDLKVEGIGVDLPVQRPRPGGVSLTDTFKVADDFLIVRTTARSVRDFLGLFDFSPLAERFGLDYLGQARCVLIVRAAAEGGLRIFDDQYRCRLELQLDPVGGYRNRGGTECPAGGLRVMRVWEAAEGGLREHQLEKVFIRPV
jgi:hypothetical protein